MRTFSPLLTARPMPREPVPFKEILPLKLKTKVSGKGDKTSDVCCLYEMSLVFACFQKNDFNQAMCSKEIEGFQKCYKTTMEAKRIKKEKEVKGILTPGVKNLGHKQLNILLSRYPQFK